MRIKKGDYVKFKTWYYDKPHWGVVTWRGGYYYLAVQSTVCGNVPLHRSQIKAVDSHYKR